MDKKKKTILPILFLLLCVSVNAQSIYTKGDKVVTLGVGLGYYLGGSGYKLKVPPVSATFEYCIIDNVFNDKSAIGIGGYVAYAANKYENFYTNYHSNYKYGWDYSYYIFGTRGIFHYQFVDKLDTYAGLMLGYNAVSSKYFSNHSDIYGSADGGGFAYSTFAGARYYFKDNFAAFAEVGYGIAAIELGITVKF